MQLKLTAQTWIRDSYSLFDYDAKQKNTDSYIFEDYYSPIAIFRNYLGIGQSIIAADQKADNTLNSYEYTFLTQFIVRQSYKDFITIQFANSQFPSQDIYSETSSTQQFRQFQQAKDVYLVANRPKNTTDQSKGLKLEVGQTIRLGKVCFGGKTSTSKKYYQKIYANKRIKKYVVGDNKTEYGQSNICKYCMSQNEDKDNFMFNPCRCSGSCSLVHIQCLLQWIQAKAKKSAIGGTMHFNFDKSICEICRTQFPVVVETEEGKMIQLLPLQKPKGDYLILQGACEVSERVIMVKNLPKQGVRIGRGNECEIRISDVTVSRNHAFIRLRESGFYIYDNRSKFGTLIRNQDMRIDLGVGQQQLIQIGRTTISLELIPKQKNQKCQSKKYSDPKTKELQ